MYATKPVDQRIDFLFSFTITIVSNHSFKNLSSKVMGLGRIEIKTYSSKYTWYKYKYRCRCGCGCRYKYKKSNRQVQEQVQVQVQVQV